jgi:hypothetical protein
MYGFVYTSRNNETIVDLRKPTGNSVLDTAVTAAVEAAKAAMKATCATYVGQIATGLATLGIKADRVILPVYFKTASGEVMFRAFGMARPPFRLVSLTGNDARPLPADVLPPKAEPPATQAKPTATRQPKPLPRIRCSPLGNKTKPDAKAKQVARLAERRARDQALRNTMKGASNKSA